MKRSDEKIPLRQGIIELYADEQLEPERLRLLRQAAEPTAAPTAAPSRPDRRRFLAAAAAVVASAGLGFWALRRESAEANLARLADEIAHNHSAYAEGRGMRLDAEADSIAALRPAFASLGFSLMEAPDDPALAGASLRGGRFCTVGGVSAVQLRYRSADPARGEVTVCQARFDPQRHRGVPDMALAAAPAELHARGLRVSLCHAQGVLMAVTAA
jgi:hypothetical protein